MTLFQCRRFQFFDLEKVDLDITIKDNLKNCQITCGTSGRGRILVGDSEGLIHSISRQLEAKTVGEAHKLKIVQMHQMRQSPYLLTFGEDDYDAFSFKVWDEGPMEQDPSRTQLLLKRTLKFTRHKAPTCFAVHENLMLLAVGYTDGYLQLYRGEVTRDRNVKPRALLVEGDHGEITGLFFKTMESTVILFVSTKSAVYSFDVSNKDREAKLQGDKNGCDFNCSCYAAGSSEDHFIVGRNDAVYCYTHEGRGPCYGFDGEKYLLYYFRGYLLIIARVANETYTVTIFDCANKFVGFSTSILAPEPIRVAASEWGCLFLLTADGTFWQLKEKDLQTKMAVFYKKNHYDLAVKVAKCNNFDADGMADIFRLYGDHLYAKGDLDGAIRQYCKTVGKLEASYVVRKYLDASRVLNLLEYLEVVHKTGCATPDLTTLLLNCLTKLKLNDKIEHYVKDPSCDFLEPETAIKVFRKGGMYKQAYQLAQKHQLYGSALQILLEDVRDPCKDDLYDILEKTIKDENAEFVLRRFGNSLVHLVGQADAKSPDGSKKVIRLLCESPVKRELVDLFIAKKDILIPLLENICQEFQSNDGPLMNLLLEAYLDQWSQNKETDIATREKILALLSKAPDCPSWDWSRALFTCKMFGFNAGEIIAYEKLGLHNDLLAIRHTDALKSPVLWQQFLETCRKYAKNKPSVWKDAFFLITTPVEETSGPASSEPCPKAIVEEILFKLLEENLMEPLPILDRLCQTKMKLGNVREFLMKVLDRKDIESEEEQSKKWQEETSEVRSHIENLRSKPCVFQSSRCNVCSQKLDFPSVHFLCLHSFHQHCFDSYAANDRDCPVCWNKNKDILGAEVNENKPSRAAMDADFMNRLGSAKSNSFAVLADFFSKGIFKEESEQSREIIGPKKSVEKLRLPQGLSFDATSSLGRVTEARLRVHEGTMGAYAESKDQAPIESYLESMKHSKPVSIDSSSFDARRPTVPQTTVATSLPFPRVHAAGPVPPPAGGSPKLTSVRKPMSITAAARQSQPVKKPEPKQPEVKNPFEEDDDANNPFLEDGPAVSKNPFEEDEDYNPSLNPFSE